MLRAKLYKGMLPVAGLLILICLYSLHHHRTQVKRYNSLQTDHYRALSEVEKLLIAAGQVERSSLLLQDNNDQLAARVFQRGESVLEDWLNSDDAASKNPSFGEPDALAALLSNLINVTRANFSSRSLNENLRLADILDQIETKALAIISDHNDAIALANTQSKAKQKLSTYVIVSGIVSSLFLMAFTAYLLSNRILSPIDALTRYANQLTDKDEWETKFKPSAKDEIASLENAFVEMAQRVSRFSKLANREIVRTRRRMEECLNNLPHPVLFFNADKKIIYLNPEARKAVDALNWNERLPDSLNQRIDRVLGTGEDILSTDFDQTITFRLENEELHFLPLALRIDNEDVNDIECSLILQNVTNLRLSDELKSDMVATVSHEIKTPVTSANLALHLLLEKGLGKLNEDQEDLVNTAVSDLQRLQRILDHLLQIARLDARSPRLSLVPATPGDIIQSVIDGHALTAADKDISLTAQIGTDLPQILADPKAIEVGLSNFLSNAIKYSPPNSHVQVYARPLPNRRGIRIGTLDEGPGIPPEHTLRAFDKFYRSSRHSEKDGIGLGLSIVMDIARAHDGIAKCEIRETGGCDFYLELPSIG